MKFKKSKSLSRSVTKRKTKEKPSKAVETPRAFDPTTSQTIRLKNASFKLTSVEYGLLREASEKRGVSLSDFIRVSLMREILRPKSLAR